MNLLFRKLRSSKISGLNTFGKEKTWGLLWRTEEYGISYLPI